VRGPYRKRRVSEPPQFSRFKPAGVPSRKLKSVILSVDEYEAIRLTDYLHLEHLAASEKMAISRPTFTRLIETARHKLAQALIDGKELIITGGNIDFERTLHKCEECGDTHRTPLSKELMECPQCGSSQISDLASRFLDQTLERTKKNK
jgi:predicted DNA-binding protein (UPF0251 family)